MRARGQKFCLALTEIHPSLSTLPLCWLRVRESHPLSVGYEPTEMSDSPTRYITESTSQITVSLCPQSGNW